MLIRLFVIFKAEKKRHNFTKTMEIATEASSHHLKTQISDLEERLRLTNENNDLLRKQLLDRTEAPRHSGPHSGPRGPSYPYTGAPVFPGLSTLPPLPPTQPNNSLFNQPPPPLPGTVVVPKTGHRPASKFKDKLICRFLSLLSYFHLTRSFASR